MYHVVNRKPDGSEFVRLTYADFASAYRVLCALTRARYTSGLDAGHTLTLEG